jgi:hypothetical protein
MPPIRITTLTIILIIQAITPTTSLPSPPQPWAAHKRALLQLQSEIAALGKNDNGEGNSTTPILQPPSTSTASRPNTPSPTTNPSLSLSLTLPSTTPSSLPQPSTDPDSLLNLLLARLDTCTIGCEIKTLAQTVLWEYKQFAQSAIDRMDIKTLYLARYKETERSVKRMQSLGHLLVHLQQMLENEQPPPTTHTGHYQPPDEQHRPPHNPHRNHHRRRELKKKEGVLTAKEA